MIRLTKSQVKDTFHEMYQMDFTINETPCKQFIMQINSRSG